MLKKQLINKKELFEVLLEDMDGKIDIIAEQSVLHTKRFDNIETILEKHTERLDNIEMTLEFIKHELKQKVGRDEFAALEQRVMRIESRM